MKQYLVALCITLVILSCTKKDSPSTPPEPVDTLLSWKKIPDTGIGRNITITDNWFANESTGVIVTSDGIYRTTDGGNTWTRTSGPEVYSNLQFIQPQIGFAQGPQSFAFTLNGGQSWTKKPLNVFPKDIFFLSTSTGFLASPSGLYKTTDTGNTWNKINSQSAHTIFFLDNLHGFIYSSPMVYKTDDAGNRWQPVGEIAVSGNDENWYLFQFLDNKNGMLLGGNTFATTTDGGVTWNKKQFDDKIHDMHFFSKDVGYLMTRKEIFKTTDGGASWVRSCKVVKAMLWEFYFLNVNTGWAVGSNGLILRLQ